MLNNKIPIIRALWGPSDYAPKNEVFKKPLFRDETVYVWGIGHNEYLQSLGYKTILMSEGTSDPQYSTIHLQYYHKLEVLKAAEQVHDEFIFLDWDCYLLKPLDDKFYEYLRSGNDVQVPIYAYPDTHHIGIADLMNHISMSRYRKYNQMTPDLLEYLNSHEEQLRKHSWHKEDMLLSPNFCFFYSRRPGVGAQLIETGKRFDIKNCIEEHSFFRWADCTYDEYIDTYEPLVLQGTADETRTSIQNYDYDNDAVVRINKYVNSRRKKDIYFKHI